jgi:hypothetical protein
MNDANFSACKYSTDILAYMYGELSDRSRSSFESHLLDCGKCTDEFAEISATRYEVYEWKKLEFDPLVTPLFEIPYEGEVAVSPAWHERLRSAFASSWAVPGFAAGALVIASLLAVSFSLLNDEGPEIATQSTNVTPAVNTSSSTPSPPAQQSSPSSAAEPPKPEGSAIRVSAEARAESVRNTRVVPPRLNDFADDEDTSLRLAQLLDDIETSD